MLDDYSRKILSKTLRTQESGFSLSDSVEIAREKAQEEGHGLTPPPTLYSDNGGGFISGVLNDYLDHHGIKHIFGTPYHPQGRGKIERFNRTIKEKLCLLVYCSPDQLQAAIDEAVAIYNNNTSHESLQNVSPNDVYAGREEVILAKRREKKRLTIERMRMYNLGITKQDPFSVPEPPIKKAHCV